ncbi:MAG: precorrin-8X methylmutase [bacterium]|nr:precorrin-8X methylmutase [bacterium]
MKEITLEQIAPAEIEKRSFEIIGEELGELQLDPKLEPIIKRVIHTTADFDYLENLYFTPRVVEHAIDCLKNGCCIVTDTKMAMSGINKSALSMLGVKVYNFIDDEDVIRKAKERGLTRSAVAMEKAAGLSEKVIFAIGNAPTALVSICELMKKGQLDPALVIGVPVGFVNVVQAKELIIQSGVPAIVAKGRKGGSNVAAAIVNAILYQITRKQ